MISFKIYKGQAVFSPLKIFAKPNSECFFKLSSSKILKYYSKYLDNDEKSYSDLEINGKYVYIFSIKLRECKIGEIFITKINRFIAIKFNKFLIFNLVVRHVDLENIV